VASVLVIDDDPAVRTTIKLILEREGHAVAVAPEGRAGLAMLEAGGISLLICDIFMPGMDGLETLREVRKRRPELPVIVMSGSTSIFDSLESAPDFLAMAVKLGAVRGMRKPFKPNDLSAVVRDCLGGEAEARNGKESARTNRV
jgi:CheY-like chemotaxis protein